MNCEYKIEVQGTVYCQLSEKICSKDNCPLGENKEVLNE